MPNYQNSKIYKIWSPSCNEIYIGATTQKLHYRFGKHKTTYKRFINGKIKISTKSREILKYDDAKIELIKYCPCNSKEELNSIEAEYIRNTENCINLKIPGRTKKQWSEDNKERINDQKKIYNEKNKSEIAKKKKIHYEKNKQKRLETMKIYRENNKQKIAEQAKQKIKCECGSTISRGSKYNHERSEKHKNFLVESDK